MKRLRHMRFVLLGGHARAFLIGAAISARQLGVERRERRRRAAPALGLGLVLVELGGAAQASTAISKPAIAFSMPSKRPALILARVQGGLGASRAS